MKRISWDEYFFNMLDAIAVRSTCLRRQVGVLITVDNHIVATGYNGQPPGIAHCTDRGFCLRNKLNVPSGQRHELCRVIHAEENAILQASHFGVKLEGGTLYSNLIPCSMCTKSILAVGIKRVVYKGTYDDPIGQELRDEAKWVKFELYSPPVEEKKVELYKSEILKPLKCFENYFISNYGRVFKDSVLTDNGCVVDTGEHIKPRFSIADNRYYVTLKNASLGNINQEYAIAYLVACAWVPNPTNSSNVGWKDGNSANNFVENLKWL